MKLSKAQRVTLQIARDLGGSIKVHPDQLRVVSSLAALGLLEINDKYFHRRASITSAGRAALEREREVKKLTPARRRALLWIKENEPVSMFPLDGSAPSLTFVKRLVGEMLVEKVGQRNMGRYGFTQYGLSPAGRAALEDEK